MEPDKLMVSGDLHGNVHALLWLYQTALDNDSDAIVQVGDFGFWEHIAKAGSAFLDCVEDLANQSGIPLFWIDGNHESHTLLRANYADSAKTPEGFWTIRNGCFYIPRGTRWVWQGRRLMGLGGAYSVDKSYRLAREQGIACPEWGWSWDDAMRHPATGAETMWWPQEEISEEELAYALSDPTPLDVLFTHDKPRASNPLWNRKDVPECYPNQDKVQTVVRTLTPKVLVHGHLHFPYQDQIRCGDNDAFTHVVGLAHDDDYNPSHHRADKRIPPKRMIVPMQLSLND